MALQFQIVYPLLIFVQNGQNFPSDHGLHIVHGGQKIELAQNIHASRGECEKHATNFSGHGLSGFGDFAPFHFPFLEHEWCSQK